jgi:hypothetical protein
VGHFDPLLKKKPNHAVRLLIFRKKRLIGNKTLSQTYRRHRQPS